MANEKSGTTPSAEEIIEALALDLGVEGEAGKKPAADGEAADKTAEADAPVPSKAKAKAKPSKPPAAPPKAAAGKAPAKRPVETTPPPVPRAAAEEKPGRKTPRAVEPAESSEQPAEPDNGVAGDETYHFFQVSPEETISQLSGGGLGALLGDHDSDAYTDEYYEDTGVDEVVLPSNRALRALFKVVVILLVTGGLLAGTYFAIPADKRSDVWLLFQGKDLQQIREQRRKEAEERRREAWLDARPKYGQLTVRTLPAYSKVFVDGESPLIAHPNRDNALIEVRSIATWQNLDVTQPHVVVITLPNYQDTVVELLPWGEGTRWNQDRESGNYYAEISAIMAPEPERAEELLARLTPTAETPDLTGEITVETDPPGATVTYNGVLLVDEAGEPLLTPVTFTSYPPPPQRPQPGQMQQPQGQEEGEGAGEEGEGEGEGGEGEEAVREPIPVTLKAVGVPIVVELEGYLPVHTGVYRHMFNCDPPEEPPGEETPFWERCVYRYSTGVIDLMTPEEFTPAEEEEEFVWIDAVLNWWSMDTSWSGT